MLLNLIPPQYRVLAALGAAVALLAVGAWTGHTWTERRWVAAVAKQEAEAAAVLTAVIEHNRAKESQDAENARKIDEQHNAEIAAANASRDQFAERLRLARGRACSGSAASTEANHSSVSAELAGSGDNGSGQPDPALALRDAALALQAYAKACHAFAIEVGR